MPRVHTLLGEVYAAANRVPEALSEFKLGLVNDDDGSVHYKLGRLYQKLGDKEKADEAFRVSKQLLKQSNDRVNLAPQ
jgi:Flp pilus assembly protein TadD